MKIADPPSKIHKLLARALDTACLDGEAENAAVHAIRHARREKMGIEAFAEAIGPSRQLPPPPKGPQRPAACDLTMPFGKHRGETLEWIGKHDLPYLRWVRDEVSDADVALAADTVITFLTMGADDE